MATLRILAATEEIRIELTGPEPVYLGRTTTPRLGRDQALSRTAVVVQATPEGRVHVHASQSAGIVRIQRADSTIAADLRHGEGHTCTTGTHVITVRNLAPVGSFVIEDLPDGVDTGVREQVRPVVSALEVTATVGKWDVDGVLRPRMGDEWRTVAALAVLAVGLDRGGQEDPGGATRVLASYAGTWFGRVVSSGWLSEQQDKAIVRLGLQLAPYAAKTPAIARWMVVAQPVGPALYATMRAQLNSGPASAQP